jgi:hypothetical protein
MNTRNTIGIILLALSFSLGAFANDMTSKKWDSLQQDNTGSISSLVRRVYLEELHRAPDAGGMATYLEYLTRGGKDEKWLRQALHDSPEGNSVRARHRARVTRIVGTITLLAILCITAFFRRRKLNDIAENIRRRYPSQCSYLWRPVSMSPFVVLFLFLYLYNNLNAGGIQGVILLSIVMVVASLLMRLPRWFVYGVVVLGMTLLIHHFVFVDARRDDRGSDRNEAVEIGAKALLRCENPWNEKSILNLPITTGPSSMVLAIPAVYFTGTIIPLSFMAWVVFLAFLLAGDIAYRNNTFLAMCLIMLFPWMGFIHTWHWALDELYYAAMLSPLVWLALRHRQFLVAGCVCGFMLFSRLSYAFAILPVGLWWLMSERRRARECMLLIAGGISYCLFMLIVLYMIGGHDFLHANFFLNSQIGSLSDHSNWLTHSLTVALSVLPRGNVGSAVVISVIVLIASIGMRAIPHPFFHIAIGLLLAHTIGFSPGYANDYILVLVIPAMYGVAFSNADKTKDMAVVS